MLSITPVAAVLTVGKSVDTAGETAIDRQRVEPTISIDPRNPNIIVAGAQDLRLIQPSGTGHRWHGYYRSTDDGMTWSSTLLPGFPGDNSSQGLASPLHGYNLTSDPVLAFDNLGNVYYAGIAVKVNPFTLTAFVAKFSADGATYSNATLIQGTTADKPWIATDTSGAAHNGNIYLAFDGSCTSGLCFTRSTDGGRTFTTPVGLPFSPKLAATFSERAGITVDPTGNVFASALGTTTVKTKGVSTTSVNVFVFKSTDGGVTFGTGTLAAANISPISSSLPGNRFAFFGTIPQISADSAGVFVVWDDNRTGSSNVLLVRSTNGGKTWSSPVTINDVATGQHFFASVAASGGRVNVVWYDSRLGQLPNGTITGLDLFYAFSIDGGVTFSPNIRITGQSFNPNLVERSDFNGATSPFIGDYIQVAASPTEAHPIWADNINACDTIVPVYGCVDQDAFTATISF